ncbi:MAG: hypothetical protein ACXW3Z_14950 [Limisphaerales bacterium]
MIRKSGALGLVVLALLWCTPPARAVILGQLDDFQGVDLMGWTNGSSSVEPIMGGGPGGALDDYIRVTADGAGAGGRLVAQNFDQWTTQGLNNYIAQGVTAIEFDLNNQSAVTLFIRIAFKSDPSMGAPGYLSAPIVLPSGSGWQHFSISITAGNMTAIGGPDAYTTFFTSGIGEMRIINSASGTDLNGDFVVAQLGIDNVLAVPEPTVTALAVGGLFLLSVGVVRRKIGRRRN